MRLNIVFVLLTCAALLFLAACSSDEFEEDTDTVVSEKPPEQRGRLMDVFDAQLGYCLNGEINASVTQMRRIDCEEPHRYEVFAVLSAGELDDSYPGSEALAERAENQCLEAFTPYVGIEYSLSILHATQLWPTEEGWRDLGDRQILCLLANEDTSLRTGAARASKI